MEKQVQATILGILLAACLISLASCTKQSVEITTESIWTGTMEVQGIPLSSTLTVHSDKSFTLDTTVTFFGVGMNFSDVGTGTVTGDSTEEGEIVFTLKEVARDILPILDSQGAGKIPLPLTLSASIHGDQLTLPDIGLGQEIRLWRQETEE